MSKTVSEFLYFRLKPSVKPEDPCNAEGQGFLKVLHDTKKHSGYVNGAWGRTKEDENSVVWVVEWSDARGASGANLLSPFLDPSSPMLSLYATLMPPISTTDTLTKNPITELVALTFPSSLSPDEVRKLNSDLIAFRTALCDKLPQEKGPRSWSMGVVERPGTMPHPKSPSGEAMMHLIVVGWESVEVHMAVRETDEFKETIAPIREKMLPAVDGLQMRHVSFQKVE